MELSGEGWVRVSVWVALLCYPAGPLSLLLRPTGRVHVVARWVWTVGCIAFCGHVVAAFHVFYGWSHTTALAETARQTAETVGSNSDVGLYLNYLFTLLWALDVGRAWTRSAGRSTRGDLALHAFLFFMVFNGAVVFADGISRALGLAVTLLLALACAARFVHRRVHG